MSNYLTKEQVNQLNEKHGWFEFGDAQSDVSMAFAQDAIAMYLAATEAAKATGTAVYGCGLGCKCTATSQHGECNADHSELSFKVKNPACQKCKGTGEQDSGGVYPWGEGINVPCDCEAARQPAPALDAVQAFGAAAQPIGQITGISEHNGQATIGLYDFVVSVGDLVYVTPCATLAATAAPVLSAISRKLDAMESCDYKGDEVIRAIRTTLASHAATAAPVLSDEQREKLEYIANWMDSSVRYIQNAPDDCGPASQFDYDMGQAAHEILSILAATRSQP